MNGVGRIQLAMSPLTLAHPWNHLKFSPSPCAQKDQETNHRWRDRQIDEEISRPAVHSGNDSGGYEQGDQ